MPTVEWLDIRTLTDADQALVAAELPQRCAQARSFLYEEDRLRSVGAGLLMLRLGLHAEADIQCGPHGKPYVSYLPHFNLSHSGNYVVCARGEAPVGVDVERVRRDNLKVARRVFTARELAWMQEVDADQRFCQLWTCKESVMKFFGEGLHMDPRTFDVMGLIAGGTAVVRDTELRARFEFREDCTLCVVWEA